MSYEVVRNCWGKGGAPSPKLPDAKDFCDGTVIKFQGRHYQKYWRYSEVFLTSEAFWKKLSRRRARRELAKES